MLRLLVFIVLLILAGIGIGMSGGVPLPLTKNKRKSAEDISELIDDQSEKIRTNKSLLKK